MYAHGTSHQSHTHRHEHRMWWRYNNNDTTVAWLAPRSTRVCAAASQPRTRLVRPALRVVVVACAFQPHFGAAPVSRNSTEFSVEYSDARNGCGVPVVRVLFVRVRVLFVRPNCVRVLYARTCAHVCVCEHTLGAAAAALLAPALTRATPKRSRISWFFFPRARITASCFVGRRDICVNTHCCCYRNSVTRVFAHMVGKRTRAKSSSSASRSSPISE